MARSRAITAKEIYDNPLVNKLQAAAGDVLSRYTPGDKRKNSIAGFIGQTLQLLNLAAVALGPSSPGLAIGLGVAILVTEVAFHAFTKGPLTESALQELTASLAEKVEQPDEPEPEIEEVTILEGTPFEHKVTNGFSIFH